VRLLPGPPAAAASVGLTSSVPAEIHMLIFRQIRSPSARVWLKRCDADEMARRSWGPGGGSTRASEGSGTLLPAQTGYDLFALELRSTLRLAGQVCPLPI
jgi:hypothetical protein